MVKDLRTGVESGNIQDVMDGNLDPVSFTHLDVYKRQGNNIGVGSFISGPVWLLQRSTLDD